MLRFLAPLLALLPLPLAAHPHVFIEAGLDFVLDDDGRLVAVDVTWIYDELHTLILVEDLGLDQDGDGVLTGDELALLAVGDQDWGDEYEGDLYGTADAAPIPLGPPERFGLVQAEGRLVSTHRRPLAKPVDPATQAVVFKVFDPWYYAAFDVTLPVRVVRLGIVPAEGGAAVEGCSVTVTDADYTEALDKVAALLRAIPADTVETDFPMVGEDFADTVLLTCGPR